MFGVTPIVPAYGRDYKSRKAIEADLIVGKDFRTASGQYIDLAELKAMKLGKVQFRFKQIRNTCIIDISKL